jgi:hypothetical protein
MVLNIPYHRQDYWFTCGAACAQMALSGLGVLQQNQSALYEDARGFSAEPNSFAIDPDGLVQVLNQHAPARPYKVWAQPDVDSISRKICWSIKSGMAPIALVFDGSHWVIVRGYQTSSDPTGPADTSYTIHGFEISNPAPELLSLPTPPSLHGPSDQCGVNSLGLLSSSIPYDDWCSWAMTRNNVGTKWRNKYVAITDPAPPPPSVANEGGNPINDSDLEGTTDEIVIGGAFGGLQNHGLDKDKDWAALLAGVSQKPQVLRVRRLDRNREDYFLVPLSQGNQLNVVVLVSGRSRKFTHAIAASGPRSSYISYLEPGSVISSLGGKQIQNTAALSNLNIPIKKWKVETFLVWRPCRESQSAYFPFYVLTSDEKRLYVRIDGKVFDRLTPHVEGFTSLPIRRVEKW